MLVMYILAYIIMAVYWIIITKHDIDMFKYIR